MSDSTSEAGDESTVPGGNGPTEIPEESPSSESEIALDKQAEKINEKKQD